MDRREYETLLSDINRRIAECHADRDALERVWRMTQTTNGVARREIEPDEELAEFAEELPRTESSGNVRGSVTQAVEKLAGEFERPFTAKDMIEQLEMEFDDIDPNRVTINQILRKMVENGTLFIDSLGKGRRATVYVNSRRVARNDGINVNSRSRS